MLNTRSSSTHTDFIDQMLNDRISEFKEELEYYSDKKVEATTHGVNPEVDDDSFTKRLALKNWIKAAITKGKYVKAIEMERTLTSFCTFLAARKVVDQNSRTKAYEYFTEAQRLKNSGVFEDEILSLENFDSLVNHVREITYSSATIKVLLCLITYSDLSKSPKIKDLAAKHGINIKLDPDAITLKILALPDADIEAILPSFKSLLTMEKEFLRKIYPLMLAIYGHIYFLESGRKTLEIIAKALIDIHPQEREFILEMAFLAQFFDGAGAQGQRSMRGSINCTNTFYRGYMLVREATLLLGQQLNNNGNNIAAAVDDAFNYYMNERASASWLDYGAIDTVDKAKKAEKEFLIRAACMTRIFNKEEGQLFLEAFNQLDKPTQKLLIKLGTDIDSWGMAVHYFATTPQNLTRVLFGEGKKTEGIKLVLEGFVCLAKLIEAMMERFKLLVRNPERRFALGEIANFSEKYPELFKVKNFDARHFIVDAKQNKVIRYIDHFIFDIGNVIVDIDASNSRVYEAFNALTKAQGIKELTVAQVKEIFENNNATVLAFHKKGADTAEFRKFFKEKLGLPADLADEAFDAAYAASILPNQSKRVEERLKYLSHFRNLGLKVFVLSNNNPIHREYINKHFDAKNWGKYFDAQYFSNDYDDLYKPSANAFQTIYTDYIDDFTKQPLDKRRGIFFDDLEVNVEAAQKFGTNAVVFSIEDEMEKVQEIAAEVTTALFRGAFLLQSCAMWGERDYAARLLQAKIANSATEAASMLENHFKIS